MKKLNQINDKVTVELSNEEYEALMRLVQAIPNYRSGGITPDGIEISSLATMILNWIQGNFYLEAMQLHLNKMKDLYSCNDLK